jgi:hypothetical protein
LLPGSRAEGEEKPPVAPYLGTTNDLKSRGLEKLDQYAVGRLNHDVFQVIVGRDRLAEPNPPRFHMGHQGRQIIGTDTEMMHGASPRFFWKLIIKINVAVADPNQYVAGAGDLGVEDQFSTEHLAVKAKTLFEIRSEQVNMVQIADHIFLFQFALFFFQEKPL